MGEEGGSGIPKVTESGRKIMHRCTIFCNRKNAKRREPGLKGAGNGRFRPPVPPLVVKCIAVLPSAVCQNFIKKFSEVMI